MTGKYIVTTGNLGWNGQKMTTIRGEWVRVEDTRGEVDRIHSHPWYCGFTLYLSNERKPY